MAVTFTYMILNNISIFFFWYLMENAGCTRAKFMNTKRIRKKKCRLGHTWMMQNLREIVVITPKVSMVSEHVKNYINELKALFYTGIIRFSSAGHSLLLNHNDVVRY